MLFDRLFVDMGFSLHSSAPARNANSGPGRAQGTVMLTAAWGGGGAGGGGLGSGGLVGNNGAKRCSRG